MVREKRERSGKTTPVQLRPETLEGPRPECPGGVCVKSIGVGRLWGIRRVFDFMKTRFVLCVGGIVVFLLVLPGCGRKPESHLGTDLSDVRVHADSQADASARAIDATAYTAGNHIVFQSGQYQPNTDAGLHTLAHELTHVVQQRQGPVDGTPIGGGVSVSDPSDRFEQQAEETARRITGRG